MRINRTKILLTPNNRRVILRPFHPPSDDRVRQLLARLTSLSEADVTSLLATVLAKFQDRHQRPLDYFLRRFNAVQPLLPADAPMSENRSLLIGAYFTQEYSLEAAALFNPSIVWHPNQTGLEPGSKRFALSLRATGEGHISSITFRTGIVDSNHGITIDEPSRFVTTPEVVPDLRYDKQVFLRKLSELGLRGQIVEHAFAQLTDSFDLRQLEKIVEKMRDTHSDEKQAVDLMMDGVMTLAKSNYQITYRQELGLSGRIIFPMGPTEINGIEDARFVEFQHGDGTHQYFATYTAYDGRIVLPQMLETSDFLSFRMHTMNGPSVVNKGMALFPRKINGRFAMLSRQDGENIFLMYSEFLYSWNTKEVIIEPKFPWELVQIGNCGSPIETDEGWLVLSHGVGPLRTYSIAAFLLDREDPSRLIGRLEEPLLVPNEDEREGYVPNVVYSCGSVVHNGQLILPYAMSDHAASFGTVPLDQLLQAMR